MSDTLALNHVAVGDIRDLAPLIAPNSVNCIVCSPPYMGLRDYGTARWEGGDAGCDHAKPSRQGDKATLGPGGTQHHPYPAKGDAPKDYYRDRCGKCGAVRVDRQLGLEPTVGEFVANLVAVFRALRPALRDDGTLWVNLGDSYANDAKWGGATGGKHAAGLHGEDGPGRGRTASGLPPKCLSLAPARFAIAMVDDGWICRSVIRWCLSGGTRVYAKTQKGIMPMTIKDLVRLNPATVQLWAGEKWTQVLGWSETPRPEQPLELTLRSGERIGCTANHQWPTRRGVIRSDELRVGDVIETTRLPDTDNLGAPALPQSVAWVAGFFLAEGHRETDCAKFSMHAKERDYAADLRRFALYYGGGYNERVHGNTLTVTITGRVPLAVLETYIAGVGSKRKHLTVAAWQRNNDFLGDLLDGYLAGDGHWDASHQRWMLNFTQNDALAADLRTLCARLGYSLRLRRCVHRNGVARHPGWRGQIRKVRSDHYANREDGEVIAIGYSRARKFWDIGVADEPHLFALASGVLTHNCKKAAMPESVTDRPTSAVEEIYMFVKQPRYWYDALAVAEPAVVGINRGTFRGGTYTNNSSYVNDAQVKPNDTGLPKPMTTTRNARNFMLLGPEPYANAHYATFPSAIPRFAIRAGCPPRVCARCGAPWRRETTSDNPSQWANAGGVDRSGGAARTGNPQTSAGLHRNGGTLVNTRQSLGWRPTCACDAETVPGVVCDPFVGSGTTVAVAAAEGRRWIACDLDGRAVGWLAERLAKTQIRLPLWQAGEAAGEVRENPHKD